MSERGRPSTSAAAAPHGVLVAVCCFLVSGVSGLVYQVVWMRELNLVFGATTLTVATVLTVFLGGLALGSWVAGRIADHVARPLRLYGLLELGVGAYCLALPGVIAMLPALYEPLARSMGLSSFLSSLVRFALVAAILVLPTGLMGATLPVLSRFVALDRFRVGHDIGRLYTINTLGGVLGAAAGGLALIPMLGMRGATCVAAGLNIAVGVFALVVERRTQADTDAQPESEPRRAAGKQQAQFRLAPLDRTRRRALAAAYAVSGCAALVDEVAWTRALALVLGSSVYAFTVMLATFLVGLSLGSAIGSRLADRVRMPLAVLAAVEAGVAISAFGGLFLLRHLPFVFLELYRAVEGSTAGMLLLTRLLIAALVMIVPTVLLGIVFPVAVRAAAVTLDSVGTIVGRLYAANTLGAIAGAFACGFLLISHLGIEGTLVTAVVLNLAAAAILVTSSRRLSHRARTAAVAALAIAALAVVPLRPAWDPAVMSSGVYRYAPSMKTATRADFESHYASGGDGETVYYRDGASASVTVQRQHGERVLKINGKPDATTAGDVPTQALLAHLPLLFHPDPKRVLVVGWGSGITVGAALAHRVERVTAVELEPAVVEASHLFDDVNGRPLDDGRTELLIDDGRNFLEATDRRFDVVISEPSNPWITGVANLFTEEYFRAGAAHLSDGGLFCQWLQIYEMEPGEVAILLATFARAFPSAYIFRGSTGDLLLLGSTQPFALDLSRAAARIASGGHLTEGLARIGVATPAALVSKLYLTPPGVMRLSTGSPINTDDNALIEYRAPLHVGVPGASTETANLDALDANYEPVGPYLVGADAPTMLDAALGAIEGGDSERAERFVLESLALADTARGHSILGELRAAAGRQDEALAEWQKALALDPNNVPTLLDLGKNALASGNLNEALMRLGRAVAADPTSARAHHMHGLALEVSGSPQRAIDDFEVARADSAYEAEVAVLDLHYGRALEEVGRYEDAIGPLTSYTARAPNDPLGFYELGHLQLILGDRSIDVAKYVLAEGSFRQALTLDPTIAEAHRGLSMAYRKQGLFDEADAEFEAYRRLAHS